MGGGGVPDPGTRHAAGGARGGPLREGGEPCREGGELGLGSGAVDRQADDLTDVPRRKGVEVERVAAALGVGELEPAPAVHNGSDLVGDHPLDGGLSVSPLEDPGAHVGGPDHLIDAEQGVVVEEVEKPGRVVLTVVATQARHDVVRQLAPDRRAQAVDALEGGRAPKRGGDPRRALGQHPLNDVPRRAHVHALTSPHRPFRASRAAYRPTHNGSALRLEATRDRGRATSASPVRLSR